MIRFRHNPCNSERITVKFGYDKDYINDSFHNGLDIGALTPGVEGDELYAVDDGIIKSVRLNSSTAGNYIILECEKYTARYLHMQKITVSVGQKIKVGNIIGYMGSTGISTGPHLHLEIKTCKFDDKDYWKKDISGKYIKAVDPESLLLKEHWAEKHFINLNRKGITIYERRFDDLITRGELFALLDRVSTN